MKKSNTPTQPNIDQISKWDLVNDAHLEILYGQFAFRKFIPVSNRGFLKFVAYAEKALEEDGYGTPGRLFYSLIKAFEGRIGQSQEERAMQRFPSHLRDEIVHRVQTSKSLAKSAPKSADEVKVEETSLLGEYNVGYLPAGLVQCFFPQKRLPNEVRDWQVNHGKTSLLVSPGNVADRNNPQRYRTCNIPHGYLSRLLSAYIIGQAVKTESPTIDMGPSLRKFLRLLNIPVEGAAGKRLTRSVEDFAAASITIGHWGEDHVTTKYARIVDEVSFWIEKSERVITFWTPEMILSDKFFDQIKYHRVPINMDHLKSFTRSPRRMDLYTWLAYRCPKVSRRGRVMVLLEDLRPIFAPDITEERFFKLRLKQDLKAIAAVYKDLNASVHGDFLMLRHSPPPLPYKIMVQNPKPSINL